MPNGGTRAHNSNKRAAEHRSTTGTGTSWRYLESSFFDTYIVDVKEPWVYVEVEITGKIDRPFLARNSVFRW